MKHYKSNIAKLNAAVLYHWLRYTGSFHTTHHYNTNLSNHSLNYNAFSSCTIIMHYVLSMEQNKYHWYFSTTTMHYNKTFRISFSNSKSSTGNHFSQPTSPSAALTFGTLLSSSQTRSSLSAPTLMQSPKIMGSVLNVAASTVSPKCLFAISARISWKQALSVWSISRSWKTRCDSWQNMRKMYFLSRIVPTSAWKMPMVEHKACSYQNCSMIQGVIYLLISDESTSF